MSDLVARLHSSESNEWYTPAQYIESARRVLEVIELDPASSAHAQKTVQAERYYSPEKGEDGLFLPWQGRFFCNPPYGWRKVDGRKLSNQKLWTRRAVRQHLELGVSGILLINSNTEATYFKQLWMFWKCFPSGRIKFDTPPGSGKKNQPTKGNVFIYFGQNFADFGNEFSQYGQIVPPLPVWRGSIDYVDMLSRTLRGLDSAL